MLTVPDSSVRRRRTAIGALLSVQSPGSGGRGGERRMRATRWLMMER